jgi:hypothetical protein
MFTAQSQNDQLEREKVYLFIYRGEIEYII